MPRLSREIVITEKIDGTNAQVYISPPGDPNTIHTTCDFESVDELVLAEDAAGNRLYAGSRTRWITPQADNYGFAAWVKANAQELFNLGPGSHFGEWWGAGIQRRYGLTEKRFSLFNTERWKAYPEHPNWPTRKPGVFDMEKNADGPACCHVVPTLYRGLFSEWGVNLALDNLQVGGSVAAPGFMDPEGIVIWHTAARIGFKKTLKDDESPKTLPSLTNPNQLAAGVEAAQEVFKRSVQDCDGNWYNPGTGKPV